MIFTFDNVDTHGGLDRLVERENLYEDVMKMYRENLDKLLEEFPFRISFKMERAVDTGGVCRDFFQLFGRKPMLNTLMVRGCLFQLYMPIQI